jgi:putative peptidoglycan lipid II flippase
VAAAGLVGVAGQVADLQFKSRLPEVGGLSSMQYATQLIQLPIGLLGAAIAFAFLPALSSVRTQEGRQRVLAFGLRMTLVLTIPAAIGLAALRDPLVALIYERGSFSAADAAQTASALLGYAPQLPFVAAGQMLVLASFARRDTRIPAAVSAVGVVVYVIIAIGLLPHLTVLGLALANSAALAFQTIVLAGLVMRRLPPVRRIVVASAAARIVGAGVTMAVTVSAASHLLGPPANNWEARVAALAIPGTLGLVAYTAVLLPWPDILQARVKSVTRLRT